MISLRTLSRFRTVIFVLHLRWKMNIAVENITPNSDN